MYDIENIELGCSGRRISRLGMGTWALGGHGWGYVEDNISIKAVKFAVDHGITFFDTADVYGLGKSEELLAKALGCNRHHVTICTKGGVRWNDQRNIWIDTSPSYLKNAVEGSLRRLKIDCIPLYYIHKTDNFTPLAESLVALDKLRLEGKIMEIGVSNISVNLLSEVVHYVNISAVQIRINIFERKLLYEFDQFCRDNSITLVAWGALADGLLTGKFNSKSKFPEDDHRSKMDDFSGEKYSKNLNIVGNLKILADDQGIEMAEMALRWILDSSSSTVSLFGAKTEKQVSENMKAFNWRMTNRILSQINGIADEYDA